MLNTFCSDLLKYMLKHILLHLILYCRGNTLIKKEKAFSIWGLNTLSCVFLISLSASILNDAANIQTFSETPTTPLKNHSDLILSNTYLRKHISGRHINDCSTRLSSIVWIN